MSNVELLLQSLRSNAEANGFGKPGRQMSRPRRTSGGDFLVASMSDTPELERQARSAARRFDPRWD